MLPEGKKSTSQKMAFNRIWTMSKKSNLSVALPLKISPAIPHLRKASTPAQIKIVNNYRPYSVDFAIRSGQKSFLREMAVSTLKIHLENFLIPVR